MHHQLPWPVRWSEWRQLWLTGPGTTHSGSCSAARLLPVSPPSLLPFSPAKPSLSSCGSFLQTIFIISNTKFKTERSEPSPCQTTVYLHDNLRCQLIIVIITIIIMYIYYALNNALSTHIIHVLPKYNILYVRRGQSYQNNISDGCIGVGGDNSDKKQKQCWRL